MRKVFILLGFAALIGGAMFLTDGMKAADDGTTLGPVTPDKYDYSFAEGCVNCHRVKGWKNRYHQENVLGVKVTRDASDNITAVEKTGLGWLDSKHATSMDGANSNSYCAYCHAPGYENVTSDPEEGKFVKKDKPGMGCVGCHPGHTEAAKYGGPFGSRFANYKPGSDETAKDSWKFVTKVDEHNFDGKSAAKQCLFCHGDYHGFNVSLHESLVKSGSLTCIDCHMAVYNHLDSGLAERYHNMKVESNGPDSCAKCHNFKKKEMNEKVAKLMGAHSAKKHKLPTF